MPIFVAYWGDNLQFYPNFALFLTLGGMNLDHNFVQVSRLSEDQKKRSLPKMEHFFPNSGEHQKKGLNQKWNTCFTQVKTPKKRSSTKMEHFFPQIQVNTKKKRRSSPKMEHFFSPNSSGHLRSRCTPESNY